MDWLLVVFLLPLITIFSVVGFQLIRGKWLMLIAGYNTATKKERDKINGRALGKIVGSLFFFHVLLMIVLLLFPLTYTTVTVIVALSLFSTIGCLIFVDKSDKFKK